MDVRPYCWECFYTASPSDGDSIPAVVTARGADHTGGCTSFTHQSLLDSQT